MTTQQRYRAHIQWQLDENMLWMELEWQFGFCARTLLLTGHLVPSDLLYHPVNPPQ
jgi:hypothetical protein